MALHFTSGRLNILLSQMTEKYWFNVSLNEWQELDHLIRVGCLHDCRLETRTKLFSLVIKKLQKNVSEVRIICMRILLTLTLDESKETLTLLSDDFKKIVNKAVKASLLKDDIIARALADSVLHRLFRHIISAPISFDALLAYFSRKNEDGTMYSIDFLKYFTWITDHAETNELTNEQMLEFMQVLDSWWCDMKTLEKRQYLSLANKIHEKSSRCLRNVEIQKYIKRFVPTLSTTSITEDIPDVNTQESHSWVNFDNWKVERYWVPEKKINDTSGKSAKFYKNTNNAANSDTSPDSSYCSDCLEKGKSQLKMKQLSLDVSHKQQRQTKSQIAPNFEKDREISPNRSFTMNRCKSALDKPSRRFLG